MPVERARLRALTEKAAQGPRRRRMMGGGEIHWSKNKRLPQVPEVSSVTRWPSSVPLGSSPASSVSGLHLSSQSPGGGPGPRDAELLRVSFSHSHVHCQSCAWPATGTTLGPVLGPSLWTMWLPGLHCCYGKREYTNEWANQ